MSPGSSVDQDSSVNPEASASPETSADPDAEVRRSRISRQSFPPRDLSSVRVDVFIYSSSRSKCARLQPSTILLWMQVRSGLTSLNITKMISDKLWMPTEIRFYSSGQAHYVGWPGEFDRSSLQRGVFSIVSRRRVGCGIPTASIDEDLWAFSLI